jgi:hypothetical protein
MSQVMELSPEKSDVEHNTQTPKEAATSITFDDLVIDGSLIPVEVKVNSTRTEKRFFLTDDLLIELQCEV